MFAYIVRRLLLIFPTIIGILLIAFPIIQLAPGGPVELMLAQSLGQGEGQAALERLSGQDADAIAASGRDDGQGLYRGGKGLSDTIRAQITEQFGFDQPLHRRFVKMIGDYLRFDFGESYFRQRPVLELMREKLPVSISLGLWLTLLSYAVCLPLGIAKAVRDGSRFDVISSAILIVGYAIPGFLLAIILIIFFASGEFFSWFPRVGLVSENFHDLSWRQKIVDYAWHLALPLTALALGAFTTTTLLVKNSFLDEINKAYVLTARAKGNSEGRVLYRHVFRNALLIVIAGFPGSFIAAFFTGSLLIEVTFGLDGLGLLGFEAVRQRDFPIIFANIYIFGLLGLLVKLLNDIVYVLVDPRIDFDKRR